MKTWKNSLKRFLPASSITQANKVVQPGDQVIVVDPINGTYERGDTLSRLTKL